MDTPAAIEDAGLALELDGIPLPLAASVPLGGALGEWSLRAGLHELANRYAGGDDTTPVPTPAPAPAPDPGKAEDVMHGEAPSPVPGPGNAPVPHGDATPPPNPAGPTPAPAPGRAEDVVNGEGELTMVETDDGVADAAATVGADEIDAGPSLAGVVKMPGLSALGADDGLDDGRLFTGTPPPPPETHEKARRHDAVEPVKLEANTGFAQPLVPAKRASRKYGHVHPHRKQSPPPPPALHVPARLVAFCLCV